MSIYQIPLSPIPSQSFSIILNNQDCIISLYARGEKYYFDLMVNDEVVYQGMIVQVGQDLTPYKYKKFKGSIQIIDLNGKNDYPNYEMFGERFIMVYDDGV